MKFLRQIVLTVVAVLCNLALVVQCVPFQKVGDDSNGGLINNLNADVIPIGNSVESSDVQNYYGGDYYGGYDYYGGGGHWGHGGY